MDEFFPGLHLSEEGTGKSRGRRTRTLLLDAAHLHAHMARLDDDGHAERVECLLNAIADLLEPPLYVCPGPGPAPERIRTGPRIGIDYAQEAAEFPWRFWFQPEEGEDHAVF